MSQQLMLRKRSLGFGTMSHILSFVHVQAVVKHENPVCRRELSVATSSVWLPAESRLSSILKSFYRSGRLPDSTIQNRPTSQLCHGYSQVAFYVQWSKRRRKMQYRGNARKQCPLSTRYTFISSYIYTLFVASLLPLSADAVAAVII